MGFLDTDSADSVDLDEALESLVVGSKGTAVPNPAENTPEPVPTRDIITTTNYNTKMSDGSRIKNIVSVEGTRWEVVFFNQYLAQDDSPRTLDMGLDATLQQYVRILDMDIYLQGDLDFSRDQATGISQLSGTARTYPGLVPQPKDHFIGTLEDGRKALLYISEVRPITYKSNTAYEFDFKLFDYANEQYLNHLDNKVIKTYYYNDEKAKCGNGLVEQEVLDQVDNASDLIVEMVDYYYDQFYTKEVETFSLKHNNELMYDHACTEFFVRMVGSEYRGRHPRAEIYSVESTEYRDKIETIWDVLITGTRLWRSRVNRTYVIRSTEDYLSPYKFNHLTHSAFKYVMSPTFKNTVRTEAGEVESENFYVFSEGFYDQDLTRVNAFEAYLLGLMSGSMLNMKTITKLIEDMQLKPKDVQFYEIPVIIWMLIRVTRL